MTPEEHAQQLKAQATLANDAWYVCNVEMLHTLVARAGNLIGVLKARHDFCEAEIQRLHAKATLMERYSIALWPRSERVEQAQARASACWRQARIACQHHAERER